MSKVILIGSDPEMFARNAQGIITSVAGQLGCDKYNKRVLADDIRLQEDNVLAEFDINPHNTFEAFDDNMVRGLVGVDNVLTSIGASIAQGVSSHIYTMEELQSFHKSAFIFGCEPDFNALLGTQNPKPAAADPGLRTAGGHVHLGYFDHIEEDFREQSQAICGVMCDYFLGMPALLMDPDDRRRELYGKAGAIRKKNYGIEYRTLSNFWIFRRDTRQFVWEQSNKAFNHTLDNAFERLVAMVDPNEIQRVINENDKRSAEKYIKLLGVI